MKRIIFSSVLVLGFYAVAEDAATEAAPPPTTAPTEVRENVVDTRQNRQDARIEQGENSGALTDQESKRLNKQQNRIERAETRAMKDGQMTGKEVRKINRMQNKASRDIYRAKHNKKTK
jgi:hypothetical protein